MAAEQTNVDVAASSEELRKAGTLGISDRIDREREGDARLSWGAAPFPGGGVK